MSRRVLLLAILVLGIFAVNAAVVMADGNQNEDPGPILNLEAIAQTEVVKTMRSSSWGEPFQWSQVWASVKLIIPCMFIIAIFKPSFEKLEDNSSLKLILSIPLFVVWALQIILTVYFFRALL